MLESERVFDYSAFLMGLAVQRSFDDLGTPLVETAFCVIDLETTGGSPAACRITEVGAVKVRGGELLGELSTLVNPGVAIPPAISALTGITEALVAAAPPIEAVLPALIEFCGDAVIVAHNASFDVGFLQANLQRLGYAPLANAVVCTVRLARRLVRDDVPNLRLATLSYALRARVQPEHRALADARATTDVFHSLLELAGRWGVTHLDDLLWFQSARGHPQYRKVRLVDGLPRARGVYLFRDTSGRVLYVGKATDLRTRVRSYFSGDDRRRIDDLLRELDSIDHVVCATDLDASVLEARLIRAHSPPYNRAQRGRAARIFLRLTDERFPRLVASRAPEGIGPLAGAAAAAVREALEEGAALRTCTPRIGPRTSFPACVRGQIGRCPAPCEGRIDPEGYSAVVAPVARALEGDPGCVLEVLGERLERLAAEERFEEAAALRDRVAALVGAVRAARAARALAAAGRLVIDVGGTGVTLRDGFVEAVGGRALPVPPDGHPDEPRQIAAWLARNAARVRVIACDGSYALPVAGGAQTHRWGERLRRLHLVREHEARRVSRGTPDAPTPAR